VVVGVATVRIEFQRVLELCNRPGCLAGLGVRIAQRHVSIGIPRRSFERCRQPRFGGRVLPAAR
jgi:hypothetical protein